MRNEFGTIFRLTSFGESHGAAIGGVIDGMPAGIDIDSDMIQAELDRRRPGQSAIVTNRNEKDQVRILSGIFEGKTTGTSIGFCIENENQHSNDYSNIKDTFRPSHADYTYTSKYGIRDYRGGGRSSARETAARVVAGAFAKQALSKLGITITAYTSQVGNIALDKYYKKYDLSKIEDNIVRCPDHEAAKAMIDLIADVKHRGDTVGGIISCVVKGTPVGLGEPVFSKLHGYRITSILNTSYHRNIIHHILQSISIRNTLLEETLPHFRRNIWMINKSVKVSLYNSYWSFHLMVKII